MSARISNCFMATSIFGRSRESASSIFFVRSMEADSRSNHHCADHGSSYPRPRNFGLDEENHDRNRERSVRPWKFTTRFCPPSILVVLHERSYRPVQQLECDQKNRVDQDDDNPPRALEKRGDSEEQQGNKNVSSPVSLPQSVKQPIRLFFLIRRGSHCRRVYSFSQFPMSGVTRN